MSEQRMIEALRECRHCGWMCAPNSTPNKSSYPLVEPIAPTADAQSDERAAFEAWFKKRGVWPRLTYLEVWQAALSTAPITPTADALTTGASQ
jgi:hypothetical protein